MGPWGRFCLWLCLGAFFIWAVCSEVNGGNISISSAVRLVVGAYLWGLLWGWHSGRHRE